MLSPAATAAGIDPVLIGRTFTLRGYLAKDKTCAPDCLVNGRDVVITPPPGPVLPPVAPTLPLSPEAAPPPLPPT